MLPAFFPGPAFGWTYYAVLMAMLAVAAYIDTRTLVIPKWLTLTLFPLGLLFNIARGIALGAAGQEVWILGGHSAWVGAVDGLLFALAGFVLGFVMFFFLWMLGTCGGGDVKLFAALAAWLGPTLSLGVLAGTLVLLIFVTIVQLIGSVFVRGMSATTRRFSLKQGKRQGKDAPVRPRQRLVSYSLPLAVVTAVVVLWVFRVDLRLADPRPASTERVQANVP